MADAPKDRPDADADNDGEDRPEPPPGEAPEPRAEQDHPDELETQGPDEPAAPEADADETDDDAPADEDAPSDDDAYDGEGSDPYHYGDSGEDYDYEQDYDYGGDDNDEYEDDDDEYEDDEYEDEDDEEKDDDGQRKMTLVEHLEELRTRIIRAAIGLAIAMAASLYFSANIIKYLNGMLHDIAKQWGAPGPITIDMVAPFMMYLKVSLYVGIILSSPWLFHQAWMFVAAGLYKHERRYVKVAVPFSSGLFIAGAAFFLLFISKYLMGFFFYFNKAVLDVTPTIDVKNHITFMTNMMLVFGLCFQMPIAVFLLGKMGLVTVKTLNRYRKYVIVVIFILAAFCTSPSPLDQIALAIPMWLLYELGVLLVYLFIERKHRLEDEAEAAKTAAEARERSAEPDDYDDEQEDEDDSYEDDDSPDEEPEVDEEPEANEGDEPAEPDEPMR